MSFLARGPLARALLCLLVLGAAACGQERRDVVDGLPRGALLAGDAEALRRVLVRAERLAETPLARGARVLRDRLAGCKQFVAASPNGDAAALLDSMHCDSPEVLPPAVRALLGSRSLVVVWPLGADDRLFGTIEVSAAGSVALDATLEWAEPTGVAALLVPGASPAGAPVLASGETLLHARFRPEAGIQIASLVPAGSQADALFRLKSELFAGAVLDGTWEAAVYLPEPGRSMPPLALALGTRAQAPAIAAMERFVSDLRATWPITRRDAAIAGKSGACFDELRILPEFAPCYVGTERALVVGWNAASVAKALGAGGEPIPDAAASLVVHLDRFPEADERLRQALAPSAPAAGLEYAWKRAELRATREGERTRLRVELSAEDAP